MQEKRSGAATALRNDNRVFAFKPKIWQLLPKVKQLYTVC